VKRRRSRKKSKPIAINAPKRKKMLKIITADERLAEVRGPKILIVGPPGVGKTTLLRTVNPATTLFIDLEAGDLAVQDVRVDQVRARSWAECRDLACFLGGPNTALANDKAYSQAHFDAIAGDYGEGSTLDKYDLYFIDSITVAARLCLVWCQQQPENITDKGTVDMRGCYGALSREMLGWMSQLQHCKSKGVVFVGILEQVTDDFGRSSFGLQIDGKKAPREIPGIVDELIGMGSIMFGEETTPRRAFLCTPEAGNFIGFVPKDRSGRLDAYEEPHLGKLIAKLTGVPMLQAVAAE